MAQFKANLFINNFIIHQKTNRVMEFGYGEDYQLSLFKAKNCVGIDVSAIIMSLLKARYHDDESKVFLHSSKYKQETSELVLSLNVIFHLIENEIFETYRHNLFKTSEFLLLFILPIKKHKKML